MGKSSSQIQGYAYQMGLHAVLCRKVDALLELKWEDKTAWTGQLGNGSIYIDQPSLFGGRDKEGGIVGTVRLLDGNASQTPPTYLTDQLTAPVPGFRGFVTALWEQLYIGNNPFLKPWKAKVANIQNVYDVWRPDISSIASEFSVSNSNIYIALDKSSSIAGANLTTQYIAAKDMLEGLKGNRGNSFRLVTYAATVQDNTTQNQADDDDIDTLKTWIDDLGSTTASGSDIDEAVSLADAFFDDQVGAPLIYEDDQSIIENEQQGRRNIVIIFTDGTANPTGSIDDAITALDATGHSIERFVFLIEETNTTAWLSLDNTPSDGIPTINANNGQTALGTSLAGWADMNPIHIIRDVILDPEDGGSGDITDIGASFEDAADTLNDEGFGLSVFHANPSDKDSFLNLIEEHIDGKIYNDRSTGRYEIKLIRNDYDVSDLFTFDQSNISEWTEPPVVPIQWELPNQITLKYTKRSNGESASMTQANTASVAVIGTIIPETVEYPGITDPDLAGKVLLRDLLARTRPLKSGAFRSFYAPTDLNLGSEFIIDDDRVGISSTVCRVVEIEEPNNTDNSVIIKWAEDKFTFDGALEGFSDIDDTDASIDPDEALPLTYQFAQEIPYWQAALDAGQSTVDDEISLDPDGGAWVAGGVRPNGRHIDMTLARFDSPDWLGVGTSDFSPYLILSENVDGQATTTTFTCAYNSTISQVRQNDVLAIDDEIVRVDSATTDNVTVTMTVGRGCLDTVPASHAAGAVLFDFRAFARGDGVAYTAGESISVRCLPRTSTELLRVEEATTQVVTFDSRANRPYPPGQVKVANSYAPPGIIGQPATVSWSHRDRTLQTTVSPEDHDDGDIGPEDGVSYVVEIRSLTAEADIFDWSDVFAQDDFFLGGVDGTLIREHTVPGTETSYDFTNEAISDFFAAGDFFALSDMFGGEAGSSAQRLSIGVRSVRGGYSSWQVPYVVADFGLSVSQVTFVAAGTVDKQSNTPGCTPGLPAGYEADDIFIALVESPSTSLSTPSGWNVIAEVNAGGTATNRARLHSFWRRATASETAPTFDADGNHQTAVIMAFRGCVTAGNPVDVQQTSSNASPDTSVSITGLTTLSANAMVVSMTVCGDDATYSSHANADLDSISEAVQDVNTNGSQGGLAAFYGPKSNTGTVGATTATVSEAEDEANIMISLEPA